MSCPRSPAWSAESKKDSTARDHPQSFVNCNCSRVSGTARPAAVTNCPIKESRPSRTVRGHGCTPDNFEAVSKLRQYPWSEVSSYRLPVATEESVPPVRRSKLTIPPLFSARSAGPASARGTRLSRRRLLAALQVSHPHTNIEPVNAAPEIRAYWADLITYWELCGQVSWKPAWSLLQHGEQCGDH